MPQQLRTDFLTIGRSGPTVDGRTIDPAMVRDAADTYDPKTFAALIWPEHLRWYNMGKVERLRAVDNAEGGVDLQAVLQPNDYYLSANAYGQKLYTSMELTRDFRKSGKFYLTGLGATDSPASAGTSEVRFSANAGDVLRSMPVEIPAEPEPTTDVTKLSAFFARLFRNSEDPDMADKATLDALTAQLTELKTQFAALKQTPPAPEPPNFGADPLAAFAARLDALEAKFAAPQQDVGDVDRLAALETQLTELSAAFTQAVSEAAPGTNADENTGGTDLNRYI